ncbi:hypothetical protein GCM10011380_01130 [Sphingomonas metalli]|uniref:Transglutaminase-like domain-containing protein n=1 Tax=Sphingomonas metalli TaxID=1779358 RepID=A0A916WM88_9SPHN|nr:transglutaminase family protein [Sphingomonas metalli]GGB15467.1 hypothetical protein GCM10011380_01130 [Sphingomonas metalli]
MPTHLSIAVDLDYGVPEPADILLQIEAAATPEQRLDEQELLIWSDDPIATIAGEEGIGQRCWLRATNRIQAAYRAKVTIDRPAAALASLAATPVRGLPGTLVAYLLPSRYCPADRFEGFVRQKFGGLSGGAMASALAEWVHEHMTYRAGTSDSATTALHSFASRMGVCRDYAHLLVALARAAEIPARCVAAYAPGVDPPDFHAVAELWLEGRWHLVDATGMARADELAIVAVGRDATDIAFMTIFGTATLIGQTVAVQRTTPAERG